MMSVAWYLILVLVIICFVVLTLAVVAYWRSREYSWLWAIVILLVVFFLGITVLVVSFNSSSKSDTESTEETTSETTVATTSITATTEPEAPTLVVSPTSVSPQPSPGVTAPTSTIESTLPTSTVEPPVYAPPVDLDQGPVRVEYVSHSFVAWQLGLASGSEYPLLFTETDSSGDAEVSEVDTSGAYFIASWDFLKGGEDESLEFVLIDNTDHTNRFSVPSGLVEISVVEHEEPTMAVILEDGQNLAAGVYGVTRFFEPSDIHSADTERCILVGSEEDSGIITCSWIHHDLIAETEIRRDLYDRGLEHILNHGVAKV